MFNKRTDEYGGSPEKNSRILLEILREIKSTCGDGYPVWIKLNCSDFEKQGDGFTFDDAAVTAEIMAQNGIDAIELSGGTYTGKHSPCRSKSRESYHLEYAEKLSGVIDTPIILVGGNRNIDTIEKILSDTDIAAISICRPLIREPFLLNTLG